MNVRTAVLLFLLSVLLCPVVNAVESPMAQLKPTLKSLTDLLADERLKGDAHRDERRAKIMKAIKVGFDFEEMSKRILGRTWQDISAEEREYFTRQMIKLLENIYVGKLESYSGQQIDFQEERVKGKRAQVSTTIDNQGVKVPVHYILNLTDSRWMVYDINIEGVSLVGNYREQFKSILRTDKFAGLIKVIEEKNKSFEKGQASL
ncbi:ABC transporter substrate-binding protein [Desulfoprunum benzoelyticum]|uniref:Phospholipid transport system substrate-binding protein n=1 Tax=Desulfoprunum benzoelyticum TaxID=1506996 RepID=A0A840V232_9BACT|nr:ABC transporter substrate-binding protein [Desulfoprunum benzoelyticum]MBB5348898.1 phospholipid transport system substrate-binding protein [Desulfoprunum benzoelyticum]MBM9530134.1 ABC transporter substrate-binding protein [Desulfoprunum benzoelyticum]